MGKYSYDHPMPAVATDIAVFAIRGGTLSILLIRRSGEPFKGRWALPGGFLEPTEDLDACARRELEEETGVTGAALQPFGNFSRPDRDPRGRTISVAYLALIKAEDVFLAAASDAAEADWFDVAHLPALAFDHDEIIECARAALRERGNQPS